MTWKKIVTHAILALLLIGSIPLFIENATAALPCTWNQTSGNLASTDANWVGGAKPVTGDDVIFDATSTANCIWDLAVTMKTISWNTGYTGIFTVAASTNWGTTGDITFNAAATFTSVLTSTITCGGNATFGSAATVTGNVILLVMTGEGTTITHNTAWTVKDLTINANVTITGTLVVNPTVNRYFTIAAGKTLTISGPTMQLTWTAYGGGAFSNSGVLAGDGAFYVLTRAPGYTVTFGVVNCPVLIKGISTAADHALTVGADTVFGSTLQVISIDATRVCTLDLSAVSNYNLTATDVTIGTRAILNGRSSTITCSGNWDSSAGTFTKGYSSVYMTGTGKTLKTGVQGFWNLVFPYGSSATLQSHVWAETIGFSGALTQAGKLINVSGAYEFALTATGSWDGDIYLNGTGTNYTIPIIVPFTPTGRIFSKVHTTYVNSTSGQLTVTPPLGTYGGIRLSRINMNYLEPANWTYTIASGNVQFELTLKPHYTYQLYADGLAWGLPVDTGSDGIAYWTYNGWSTVTFNLTGAETVVIPSTTTTVLTFVLALAFGFGLLFIGFKRNEFMILAGPVWIIISLTIFLVYGDTFMMAGVGIGIVSLFTGVLRYGK